MLKEDLQRELKYKMRQKVAEQQPEEKSFGSFLSNLTKDLTMFGKGFLALGKKAVTHPVESTKTVGGVIGKVLPHIPSAAEELMRGIGETFTHPIERTKQIKTEWEKVRAISYDEQKQFIAESLSQAEGIKNKEERLATQIGLGLIGDFMQEVSHPVEFMYEKPFTFGIDIMAVGGGKIVGRGTKLAAPILKDTKLAAKLETIFTPMAKLKRAGYTGVAEDLASTGEKIYNMQEKIIKATAHKFEKVFKLSGAERLQFFDTIDKLRRTATKAVSENPKIQKAIDWWLDSEVPKISKVAGLPAEKQIRNYLHHFFPERLTSGEKATRPFKIKEGYLKKSKDIAGFTKDPIVSISAIKIKVALDAIKNSFLTRTVNKYGKNWKSLQEEFKGIVGLEEYTRLEKAHALSQAIQKRMNIDIFSPKKGVTHWLPKEIAEELNKMYGKSTTLDTIRTLLSPLDAFNRNWKPLATAVRPRYHTRNIIGNLYNAIAIGKTKIARLPDAAIQQITGYLNEVRRGAGVSAAIAKKLFPEKLSSKYIDLATKNNIIGRGFFSIDLHDMSKAIQASDDIIKTIKRVREPAEIYKIPVLKQYLNLSRSLGTALEDNARLAMFIDFVKKAKSTSPATIAKAKAHVNKHLFDYLAGLGEGDRFIKKFIPFWAWTRFNLPLQVESVFTIPRRLAAIQKGTAPYVREKEKEDPSVKFFTEQEQRMGLFKTGEVEVNGRTLDKYMRTQSVLPQADLLKIVELFKLDLDALGVNPIVGLLARLDKNLNYFGGQIERFTGEKGKFFDTPISKKGMEIIKIIPFLNEINKLIGGSYVDEERPSVAIRLEQVISPIGVTLKDPDQVKYFGILEDEAELKGSFEAGLESLYVKYLSESRQHPGELQFKQNVELLEKLLLQKGLTPLSLIPLKMKAVKRCLQTQLREKIKYGDIDKLKDDSIHNEIRKYFAPIPGNVRFRDIGRELYELIMPDIAQTPEEAKQMGYTEMDIVSEENLAQLNLTEEEKGYGLYGSPDGFAVMIGEKGGTAIDPFGTVGALKQVGKVAIKQVKRSVFSGFKDITTSILNKLKGKYRVSKQFISDLTKMPEVKKAEREIIEDVLKGMPEGRIGVQEFADKVKSELLPLKYADTSQMLEAGFLYRHVTLPKELQGKVVKYNERIYESPIKTSAGQTHFSKDIENYFAHTRIEEMGTIKDGTNIFTKAEQKFEVDDDWADTIRNMMKPHATPSEQKQLDHIADTIFDYPEHLSPQDDMQDIIDIIRKRVEPLLKAGEEKIATRRVIELQSDLFQKGRLKEEAGQWGVLKGNESVAKIGEQELASRLKIREKEIARLEPYHNIWHERIIKEEIKKASQDGKSILQFPTGETAMKIEGIGDVNIWNFVGKTIIDGKPSAGQSLTIENLKIGKEIVNWGIEQDPNKSWIITNILRDGKFKAVPKTQLENIKSNQSLIKAGTVEQSIKNAAEQFDISGKIDTSNPIYKFYESTVQKYLKKIHPDMKRIKDPQGVEWFEIPIRLEKDSPLLDKDLLITHTVDSEKFAQIVMQEKLIAPSFAVQKVDTSQLSQFGNITFLIKPEVVKKNPLKTYYFLGDSASGRVGQVQVSENALGNRGSYSELESFLRPLHRKKWEATVIKDQKEIASQKNLSPDDLSFRFLKQWKDMLANPTELEKEFQDVLAGDLPEAAIRRFSQKEVVEECSELVDATPAIKKQITTFVKKMFTSKELEPIESTSELLHQRFIKSGGFGKYKTSKKVSLNEIIASKNRIRSKIARADQIDLPTDKKRPKELSDKLVNWFEKNLDDDDAYTMMEEISDGSFFHQTLTQDRKIVSANKIQSYIHTLLENKNLTLKQADDFRVFYQKLQETQKIDYAEIKMFHELELTSDNIAAVSFWKLGSRGEKAEKFFQRRGIQTFDSQGSLSPISRYAKEWTSDATSPIDAFSQFAIPTSLFGAKMLEDKDSSEKKEGMERRELKPGETMVDMKTGIEFYRPKEEGTVEVKELKEEGTVEIGTEEEFKEEESSSLLEEYKVRENKYAGPIDTIGGLDLETKPYATSTRHVQRIQTIYATLPEFNTADEMKKELSRLKSPLVNITNEIFKALNYYKINARAFLAVIRQDSNAGTTGAAVETKNPGNVGNVDTGELLHFDTWLEGAIAAIRNLAERKTLPQ